MKLTKSSVDRLPTPSPGPNGERSQTFYRDGELRCFGVRVTSHGQKSFIVEKRINGKPRRLTLGRYGDELTVEQARKMALKTVGEIATGIDPGAERRQAKARGVTLRDVFTDYLAARKNLKPGTIKDYHRILDEAFDDWKGRPLADIDKDMVQKRHTKLGQRSPARANNAMRVLRALFNYATGQYEDSNGHPLFTENPTKRLSQTRAWFRVVRRKTYIKPSDLPHWWQAVTQLEDGARQGSKAGVVTDWLQLLLLTGLRRSEALLLKPEHVNLKERTLTIPDPKNHEPHTLPLPDFLCELLARRMADGGAYVFSGVDPEQPLVGPKRAIQKLVEMSGVEFTPHDLRRTFITIAESLDIPAYALKRLLNHKMANDVTAGYIVNDVERLRAPMQKITDHILRSAAVKKSADVIPMLGSASIST